MIASDRYEYVQIDSGAALRDWLEAHHEREEPVWLVTFKKAVPERYVSTDEVLDELLCQGWIDSIRRKLDDERTMQLIAPRKAQHWAASYKQRAARLEREGRMRPAGRRAIARGKRSGLWTFMDDVDKLIVPDDLAAALDAHPPARERFDAFPPSSRRNMLRRIKLAKTERTRVRLVDETARLAAEGRKVPQT